MRVESSTVQPASECHFVFGKDLIDRDSDHDATLAFIRGFPRERNTAYNLNQVAARGPPVQRFEDIAWLGDFRVDQESSFNFT